MKKKKHIEQYKNQMCDFRKESERMPKKSLLDFFREAPMPDLDIDFKRNQDQGKDVNLFP